MDFNQLYGQFSNEIWSHFQSSELAAGRKTATFRLWVKRSKVARRTMSNYLREHGAPQGNPYFWVQHFPEPTERTPLALVGDPNNHSALRKRGHRTPKRLFSQQLPTTNNNFKEFKLSRIYRI